MKNTPIENLNQDIVKPIIPDVFLFLDDIREPEHAFDYTKQEMFLKQKWEVVRNFDEFKSHIENNGMPYFISFDHDLADTHYTPEHLWDDYDKSKEWQEAQVHKEKTEYDCAMCMIEIGETFPSKTTISLICSRLKVPQSYLLFLSLTADEIPEDKRQTFIYLTDAIKHLLLND
jgi:hypothetical protein